MSERRTTLSSASATERGRAAALTAAFLRGGLAAGLGLGALAVLVVAAWISSPYPDSGAGGALRIAAALWLLAHGAELVRPDTLSGVPAPVGLVPLLVTALPAWLVYRSARDALEPDENRPQLTALGAVCTVGGGYLLVGAAVVLYARGGPLSTNTLDAAVRLPLVPLLSAVAGSWVASGRPLRPLLARLPGRGGAPTRAVGRRRRAVVAVRAATAGTTVLLGGGLLLVVGALVWHGGAAQESFLGLTADWSGRIAVLLLSLALLPNAAVWGASYALGPGFALGTSVTVTPLAVTGSPVLPPFPLLAAVPGEGPGMPVTWAAGVVPLVAGLVIAGFTVRVAAPPYSERDEAWSARETTLAVTAAGIGCAVLIAVPAALAGGPIGTGRLAEFGPVWWLTGAAALAWTVGIGVPAALLVRAWRLRARRATHKRGETNGANAKRKRTGGKRAGGTREGGAAEVATTGARAVWWRRRPWGRGRATGDGTAAGDHRGNGDARDDEATEPAPAQAQASAQDPGPEPAKSGTGEGRADGPPSGRADEPYPFPPMEVWHDRDAQEARWAAIRQASGGLMADFPPTQPPTPSEQEAEPEPAEYPEPRPRAAPSPRSEAEPFPDPHSDPHPDPRTDPAPNLAPAPHPASDPESAPDPQPAPQPTATTPAPAPAPETAPATAD
ncbi:DUF6350 family protein [Streptomyces sp. NBC_01498]|uniref:cell division protein PerM n=1 Tax=Streptomyces sp. NBC_01498 TaxID=2975870 RepID=UPI002E7B2ABD|nr:DUF6350 family protein [Streptomyces sp. NBC_01498]WTL25068.1 DUF6350 family protein [Streptomyces sp. NBC_01498]